MLNIGGVGVFHRRDGDIYWIGVEEESSLLRLQRELVEELKDAGFPIDDRKFKPHLTLGRRVTAGDKFHKRLLEESISSLKMEVDKISLMKSERCEGKLVYTEIYHAELEKA